jgi:formamidopyrimidine-DNA glycosylase
LLLDQTIISGLGNIYVDEVLFRCKIHPNKLGKDITLNEAKDIVAKSKDVFTKAIELGGATIGSYTSSLGVSGKFQNELMVHTRKDKECKICKTKIEKTKVNGRGTYYCPKCQRV